jgi:hypothetical protein
LNLNRKLGQKKKKALRRHRNVGLGFKTPREVCLFHVFALWWLWWLVIGAAWKVVGENLLLVFILQGIGRYCLIWAGLV